MKKYIFIIFLSMAAFTQAQVSCYLTGGSSHGIDLNANSQPGFNLGAIVDLPFSKAWSFQTGLNFNSVSIDSNWEVLEYVVNKTVSFDGGKLSNFSFLEIPAVISSNIKLSEKSKLKFNAGGYFSIFTGGSSLYRSSKGYSDYVLLPTYSYPVGGGILFGTGIEINKLYLGVEANFNIPDGYKPNTVLKTKIGIRL
ncbi:MAG: outer membrane beta-barrel protein [Paludibacter sp.]|nr:outer membrane beta-barrel protein [Paludibacter sp.]